MKSPSNIYYAGKSKGGGGTFFVLALLLRAKASFDYFSAQNEGGNPQEKGELKDFTVRGDGFGTTVAPCLVSHGQQNQYLGHHPSGVSPTQDVMPATLRLKK